jgi:hypothetical protein
MILPIRVKHHNQQPPTAQCQIRISHHWLAAGGLMPMDTYVHSHSNDFLVSALMFFID